MRKMMAAGIMSQADLNDIENAVAARTGSNPRAW
jgi:hypothetical protein